MKRSMLSVLVFGAVTLMLGDTNKQIIAFTPRVCWACGPLNLMKISPSRMQNKTGSERRD